MSSQGHSFNCSPFDYKDSNHDSLDSNSATLPSATRTFPNPTRSNGSGSDRMPLAAQQLLSPTTSVGLNVPSPLGLPIYSASGFDLMSILARVATRPHPKIVLGPVDLTCSFVVVDVRRFDRPIVYASPTFCQLTGYTDKEVLGRNCRFLQSPDGNVRKGEGRRFVAPETVQHLYKAVVSDKECQASIINYRKGGQAFINLVTIIPIHGGVHNRPEEADEVVYHVGFQVDLTEQPNAILQRLWDGSYIVNYGAGTPVPSPSAPLRDRRANSLTSNAISQDLCALLSDATFLNSLPISTSTTARSTADKVDNTYERSQILNLLLLESSPDFIHVLSLKGFFLYVAPSIRNVLGFEPDELVGKSIADYCHPADLVPLMRELKESSVTPSTAGQERQVPPPGPWPPKTVDLLFRAHSKFDGYVWVECRGRLHVEPGKGRKAIFLSGRVRPMPIIRWRDIARGGGLAPTVRDVEASRIDSGVRDKEREFWGMLSPQGTFLVVGSGIRDVLGWAVAETIGKSLLSLVISEGSGGVLLERLDEGGDEPTKIKCEMVGNDGQRIPVQIVVYRSREQTSSLLSAPSIIIQVKAWDTFPTAVAHNIHHSYDADVFEELGTSRGSSWQYELQQLKFANRRLHDQIESLESSLNDQEQVPAPAISPIISSFPEHIRQALPVSRALRVGGHEWGTPELRDYDVQRSLKRPWGQET